MLSFRQRVEGERLCTIPSCFPRVCLTQASASLNSLPHSTVCLTQECASLHSPDSTVCLTQQCASLNSVPDSRGHVMSCWACVAYPRICGVSVQFSRICASFKCLIFAGILHLSCILSLLHTLSPSHLSFTPHIYIHANAHAQIEADM